MNIKHYIALFLLASPSYMFASEGGSGFPQLDVSKYPSQIFWLILCFTFLYIVIFVHFSPKLHKIAKNRSSYLSVNLKKLIKFRDSIEQVEQDIKKENELKSKSIEDMNFKLKNKLKNHLEQEMKVLEEEHKIKHEELIKEQSKLLEKEKGQFENSVSVIAQDILAKVNINIDSKFIESYAKKESEEYTNNI